jgi:hypothetical protein
MLMKSIFRTAAAPDHAAGRSSLWAVKTGLWSRKQMESEGIKTRGTAAENEKDGQDTQDEGRWIYPDNGFGFILNLPVRKGFLGFLFGSGSPKFDTLGHKNIDKSIR